MTDVLAVAEHRHGSLRDVSLELVTAGRELSAQTGGSLHVAVINGPVEEFAGALDREGVETVHTIAADDGFNHDVYHQSVRQLVGSIGPSFVLAPHSVNGMDYAPAVATSLDWPLVTDVTGLDYTEQLTVTREFYGGKVEGTVDVRSPRAVLTIRPTEWAPTEAAGSASRKPFTPEIDQSAVHTTVNGFDETTSGDIDISDAEFIVSVGRGIDEQENMALVEDLADALGATLAGSGPVVGNGWLPKGRQVGQSGKVVKPDVYIAVGISGAIQHRVGMNGADTIVAINTDPDAPILEIADYAIVDDLFEVVPELIEAASG